MKKIFCSYKKLGYKEKKRTCKKEFFMKEDIGKI